MILVYLKLSDINCMPVVSLIAIGHLIPRRTGNSEVTLKSRMTLLSEDILFSGLELPLMPQNSRGAIWVSLWRRKA